MTFHRDGQTIVVDEVPADICENCGDPYVAEDVTMQLMAIADDARNTPVQVLVLDFAPAG